MAASAFHTFQKLEIRQAYRLYKRYASVTHAEADVKIGRAEYFREFSGEYSCEAPVTALNQH
jgi:hypothetical protein